MDIKDLIKDIDHLDNYRLEHRFHEMIYNNPSYRHLDHKNQEILLDLLKKYLHKIKRGIHISSYTVHKDMYHLYRKRIKLELSKEDLRLIKKVLNSLKY